jgi:hypothetical protein
MAKKILWRTTINCYFKRNRRAITNQKKVIIQIGNQIWIAQIKTKQTTFLKIEKGKNLKKANKNLCATGSRFYLSI